MSLTIEQQARAMYEDCPTVKPDWEQLGDVTKSVWREMAEMRREPPRPQDSGGPAVASLVATGQASLF